MTFVGFHDIFNCGSKFFFVVVVVDQSCRSEKLKKSRFNVFSGFRRLTTYHFIEFYLADFRKPNLCTGSNYFSIYFKGKVCLFLKHFKSKNEACSELCFPWFCDKNKCQLCLVSFQQNLPIFSVCNDLKLKAITIGISKKKLTVSKEQWATSEIKLAQFHHIVLQIGLN